MSAPRSYIGIDRFRPVAALLVVAVHTGPLLALGEAPEYFFTHVLARIAVPFFFAASGFFLLPPCAENRLAPPGPIFRAMGKAALLYAIAVLLYLPVNLYAGHFAALASPGQLLKMLLVDGTMYHLWYLPAAVLGLFVTWLLLRRLGARGAMAVAAGLYVVGLLGDNYSWLAESLPFLRPLYVGIFAAAGYTRNGLFYAPVFLLAGLAARRHENIPRRRAGLGLALCLALLLAEGLLLWPAAPRRHDSMYLALPACAFFLTAFLAGFRGASLGKNSKRLRRAAMLVYLLHPGAIVLLRGGARALGLEGLLVQNSLAHYAAVCALSLAGAWALVFAWELFSRRFGKAAPSPRAWAEIDLDALGHNLRVLKKLLPEGCAPMPVLKADAYGLGAVPIAKELYRLGVRSFCVATLAEGMALRKRGLRGDILVLGYTPPEDCRLLKRYRLAQAVVDYGHALSLSQSGLRLAVHLKVDTGMHRLGFAGEDAESLAECFALPGLCVEGIFTQLGSCDSPAAEAVRRTEAQAEAFRAALDELKKRGIAPPPAHIQCSYGILNYPGLRAAWARPGLALYGIVDESSCRAGAPALAPVLALRARVALVREVEAGACVGYGSAAAPRAMRVAVLTIGYADGLPRALSNGAGGVLLNGRFAPFVGNICMDQSMVDASEAGPVAPGDVATLIGADGGAAIGIHNFARAAGTIPNEITSRLGGRLERRYLRGQGN